MESLTESIEVHHIAILALLIVVIYLIFYHSEHASSNVGTTTLNSLFPNLHLGEHAMDPSAFNGAADPELANPLPLSWTGEQYGVPAKVPRTKPLNPNGVYCGQYNANYAYPHTWIG